MLPAPVLPLVVRKRLGLNVRAVPIPQAVADRLGLKTPHGVEVVAVEMGRVETSSRRGIDTLEPPGTPYG